MIKEVVSFFNAGGDFMWVILAVFAVAIAVVIERCIFYYGVCRVKGGDIVVKIREKIDAGDVDAAKSIAGRGNAPVNVLLYSAVDAFAQKKPFDEIQESVDETAISQMPRLTARLNYLSLFANIGTLLGLLGTIAGLQVLFSSLAAVEAEKKAAMLAAGIAQAMNATAFGLIVAVPCMVLYTTFFNTQQRIAKELDEAMVRLLNYLKKKVA